MNDINYALEWYRYGLNNQDDAVFRFMMHWIAFNWLYSEYRYDPDTSEKDAIREYCRVHYRELSRFDAFSTDAISVFLKEPVRDIVSGFVRSNGTRQFSLLRESEGLTRMTSLILTIYQVRCNLFHGSKSLRIERDLELVHASAAIMEGYLRAVLS